MITTLLITLNLLGAASADTRQEISFSPPQADYSGISDSGSHGYPMMENVSDTEFSFRMKQARGIVSTAASDAIRVLTWIEWQRGIILNNLSNIGTIGHKRFDPWSFSRVHSQGSFRQTENQLHLAIEGDGFFMLELADGSRAYTRHGGFERSSAGRIITPAGHFLDPPISVPEDAVNLEVNEEGVVTAQMSDGSLSMIGQIQLANFINPSGLQTLTSASNPIIHFYRETASSGPPRFGLPGENGTGFVRQGFVELSNVSSRDEEYSLEILRKHEKAVLFGLRAMGINLP